MQPAAAINKQIAALPIPGDIKVKYALLEDKPDLFALITGAFAKKFSTVDSEIIPDLSLAIYLGAKAVYAMDPVLDNQLKNESAGEPIREGHFLYLESQRLLAKFFHYEHKFWKVYYSLINDHYEELSLSKQPIELTHETYLSLLKKKYALLFMPLEVLHYLSGKAHLHAYNKLRAFIEIFIVGYNIPNEIRGMGEDLSLKINNYAYWRLKALLPEFEMNADDYGPEELHKLLYASGLALTLYNEALGKLTSALKFAEGEDMPELAFLVQGRMQQTSMELEQVEKELSFVKEKMS